jgi:endonuclease/exonuclease/phosphatase (EEP) superfamily protein YafD
VRRARRGLSSDDGQGLVSALILLAGVLLPLLFLVPLFARLEQGRLVAEQAARDAVRVAVVAPNADAAQAAAANALARARTQTREPLRLELGGQFARGGVLRARVRTSVVFASLPFVGRFGTVGLSGRASAPVDRYRSLLGGSSP